MQRAILAAALLASVTLANGAQAQSAAALIGDDTLAMIDVAAKKVTKTVKVTGAPGRILGIDVRPADGMLYALAADGTILIVDTATGKATVKSKLDTMLPAGVVATVDFNPVADRLRVIGSDGTNLRANVDDGKVTKDGALKFADTDSMKGKPAKVVAGAYTNSMKGAKETALYDVDASGALLRQAPPNDGILNTVGMIGVPVEGAVFDITTDAAGKSQGWLMSGETLHSVDLATGKATMVAKIAGASGPARDIAALPGM
ncbi:hypothetical protein OPKNFCMD_6370 [Methylobacterium crusticola]|uniref:DUF4394 domain-containing protein n=1 Tax=Methylobacterium crusticola TaxID=1697972 RepID=A0ABQ4R7C9_9HYPH|nr:DUF4394 domain-containing protein [Methylobacterium crusticola]GJD53593.1 hypothetical protein OPKNFCMD_6370 [Methylobacterium crusticola]